MSNSNQQQEQINIELDEKQLEGIYSANKSSLHQSLFSL
jgi:hypothetical protein